MHEPVDDILQRRKVEPRGLRRVMSTSLAIHVGTVLVLFLMPKSWYVKAEQKVEIMTISLAGSPGVRSGGMVAAGARPVEKVEPPPKRPEPIPPATPVKPDVMTVPTKTPPKTAPTPSPTPGPPSTVTRPPTTGTQLSRGTSVAETGSTSQSTGQSTGGGFGGASLETEVPFCCKDYLDEVVRRIQVNWQPRRNQPEAGTVVVVFEILRDGSFTKPVVEGAPPVMLKVASLSVFDKLVLQRLPDQYKDDRLKIRLTFPYVR